MAPATVCELPLLCERLGEEKVKFASDISRVLTA